jgi:hypothetical protein
VSDRLALANAIEDAGIERAKAEGMASAIARFVDGNAATRADVTAVRQDLRLVETALKADLRTVEIALKADLRTAIGGVKHDLTMRGITGLIAAGGILFAALHMWPPHG